MVISGFFYGAVFTSSYYFGSILRLGCNVSSFKVSYRLVFWFHNTFFSFFLSYFFFPSLFSLDANAQVILILTPKLLDFHLLGKQQIMPLRWLFQILDTERELQRKWAWTYRTWVLKTFV